MITDLYTTLKNWAKKNRAHLLVFGLFWILACIYWYPLPFYFRTHQLEWPVIDPAFNQWILAWENHAIWHYPWKFFEANMFYPFPHTLAWGDHLFSLTIFAVPLIPLFGVLGAYNILLLGTTALSGFTAYLLAHYLTKHRAASILAGVIWALSYYRATESGHIQSLSTQWIPLVFLFAEKVRTEYSKKNFIYFTVYTFLMLATNIYLALFTVLAFAVYGLMILVARLATFKTVLQILLGWAIAGVLALPLYLPSIILQFRHPIARGYDSQGALNLHGLLPTPWPGHIMRKLLEITGHADVQGPTYHTLGILSYPLLLLAIVFLIREWRNLRRNWIIVTLFVIAVVSFLAAAGPTMRWEEHIITRSNPFFVGPYHFVAGYKALRTPMRWFFIGSLCTALISAWTYSKLTKQTKAVWHSVIIAVAIIVIIVEQAPAPIKTHANYSIADYPAYQWLTKQPGEFAILELPIFPGTSVKGNDVIEARRMVLSTVHWKKRVSGAISPYIPQEYVEHALVLNALGDNPEAIKLLKDWNVKYVVFDPDDYADLGWDAKLRDEVKNRLDHMPELEKQQEFTNGTVYSVK